MISPQSSRELTFNHQSRATTTEYNRCESTFLLLNLQKQTKSITNPPKHPSFFLTHFGRGTAAVPAGSWPCPFRALNIVPLLHHPPSKAFRCCCLAHEGFRVRVLAAAAVGFAFRPRLTSTTRPTKVFVYICDLGVHGYTRTSK